MSGLNNSKLNLKLNRLRLLPYIAIGGVIFYFNSNLDFNYLIKSYLVLMESQICILMFYLINCKYFK